MLMLGYFAALRKGHAGEAAAFLKAAPVKCDTSAWPYPIVRFLNGEIDESELLAGQSENARRTDVHCFVGLELLARGKKDQALVHLRWVKSHGNPDSMETALAVSELERMGGK